MPEDDLDTQNQVANPNQIKLLQSENASPVMRLGRNNGPNESDEEDNSQLIKLEQEDDQVASLDKQHKNEMRLKEK